MLLYQTWAPQKALRRHQKALTPCAFSMLCHESESTQVILSHVTIESRFAAALWYQGEHGRGAHLPPCSRCGMNRRRRRVRRIPQLEPPGFQPRPRVISRTVLRVARRRAAHLRVLGVRAGLLAKP